jgi:translation initiation factor IF-2
MDKVKIQEIADEAGLSNGELLDKAKELGFDVKAANSTISMQDAGILVDYAISGTLPKGFTKPGSKSKITVVKKKVETVEEVTPEAPVITKRNLFVDLSGLRSR